MLASASLLRVATSWPNSVTSPRVGRSDRNSRRKSELLPAPDGPVMNWNDRASMRNVRSRRTSGPRPYRNPTCSNRTTLPLPNGHASLDRDLRLDADGLRIGQPRPRTRQDGPACVRDEAAQRELITNEEEKPSSVPYVRWIRNPAAVARYTPARAEDGSSRRSAAAILRECDVRAARRSRRAPCAGCRRHSRAHAAAGRSDRCPVAPAVSRAGRAGRSDRGQTFLAAASTVPDSAHRVAMLRARGLVSRPRRPRCLRRAGLPHHPWPRRRDPIDPFRPDPAVPGRNPSYATPPSGA